MKKVKNISNCGHWKDIYQIYAEEVSKLYPDYDIIVDGGSYRFYDVKMEVNTENKVIGLDFYLPLYINWPELKKWIINEMVEKYGVKAA